MSEAGFMGFSDLCDFGRNGELSEAGFIGFIGFIGFTNGNRSSLVQKRLYRGKVTARGACLLLLITGLDIFG